MPPPNWSDPLPVLPVNNGDPPRILMQSDIGGSGTKRSSEPTCLPYRVTYGKEPLNPDAPVKTVSCPRHNFARLGRKIIS